MANYETVWSGTLERQRLCPSISGYLGGSTAGAIAWSGRAPEPKRKKRVRSKTVKPRVVQGPRYEAISNRLRRGYSYRSTAQFFGITLSALCQRLRKGKQKSDYDRLRREKLEAA